MVFTLKNSYQPSTPATYYEFIVEPSTGQLSITSSGGSHVEWSPESVSSITSIREPILRPNSENNCRGICGLFPPIQLTDSVQPLTGFSENDTTFPFRTSYESRNNDRGFIPLPPDLPLPCARSGGLNDTNKALGRHMQVYLPQVQKASRALWIALESKSEKVFEKSPQPILPMFKPLWDKIQAMNGIPGSPVPSDLKVQHLARNDKNFVLEPPLLPGTEAGRKLKEEGGVRFYKDLRRARNVEGHWQTSADIDIHGLKPWLFRHELKPYSNQGRPEILSLSFHDLTPDAGSGAFQDELIRHFDAESPQKGNGGTELMLYEFYTLADDLPWLHHMSNARRQQHSKMQRWIVFSISNPIVTFSQSAIAVVANSIDPHTRLGPPNLPHPPPESRLMFAVPFENITAHPATNEVLESSSTYTPSQQQKQRTVLRYDFDFSRNFSPIFEFCPNLGLNDRVASDLCIEALRGEFLGVSGMRAYDPKADKIIPWDLESPVSHYSGRCCDLGEELDRCKEDDELNHMTNQGETGSKVHTRKDKYDIELKMAMAGNKWWHEARDGFAADAKAWQRIREAMARGCCRVVARMAEFPEIEQLEMISENQSPPRTNRKRGFSAGRCGRSSVPCRGLEGGRKPAAD